MPLTHHRLRQKFIRFWKQKDHKEIPPIPLVPKDDPTTLFTGSGMQQLVPYLLGEPHPLGEKLVNIQPCFRAQDIEEVGDNRHTTFFEMMGNWSLGTYFKKEQLLWFMKFLVEEVGLPPEKLYVTVFKGDAGLAPDEESITVWQATFKKYGVSAKLDEKIIQYGNDKNWWSRAGSPKQMPAGEPGGPDSEVFYDFGEKGNFHESSPWKNQLCHVNCNCGRYLEIGNSVFMQYRKQPDGSFAQLPKKNVDFGGGLERILAAANDNPDIFMTDLYFPIIQTIKKLTKTSYAEKTNQPQIRIIADHLKAAVFMAKENIEPSNKEQGYVMRRLIRRAVVKMLTLAVPVPTAVPAVCNAVINIYNNVYLDSSDLVRIQITITKEANSFITTVNKGIKLLQNQTDINGKLLFDLKQSYGFPLEIALEMLQEWEKPIDVSKLKQEFDQEYKKHQQSSRQASAGKFKGGLADHSDQVVKYHTATHLLHQALHEVLGGGVRQEGSNITAERLRFDFYSPQKPTDQQKQAIEELINQKIAESLPVFYQIMPKKEAEKSEAKFFFKERYPEMVKVYYIGRDLKTAYSKEFCGGPHVTNIKKIGKIAIYKLEKIGSNLYRIYAK